MQKQYVIIISSSSITFGRHDEEAGSHMEISLLREINDKIIVALLLFDINVMFIADIFISVQDWTDVTSLTN